MCAFEIQFKTFIPLHLDKNQVTFLCSNRIVMNEADIRVLTLFFLNVVLNTFHLVTYLEFRFCSLLLFKLLFKIAFFICSRIFIEKNLLMFRGRVLITWFPKGSLWRARHIRRSVKWRVYLFRYRHAIKYVNLGTYIQKNQNVVSNYFKKKKKCSSNNSAVFL